MRLVILICVIMCGSMLNAQKKEDTIVKLETTAKKIRTAKIFYSDEQIKKKIIRSMETDEKKWKQARIDYLNVIKRLKELNVDVEVPETLDELLIERVDKDADKILMMLASEVKKHLIA